MQLRQALTEAVHRLDAEGIGSPRRNAETLLMFILDCDRAYLYAHPERELSLDLQARYENLIALRASGYPAQYITGHQEFWGLDLIVTPAVLIPRPETEHVVETALELARAQSWRSGPRLVDVGTGSGAIALALAKELPQAEIYGLDLSAEALEIARANAARLQLDQRVRLLQSDVLQALPPLPSFDFVLSNPPYVALSEADKVQDVVKKFEPKMAVFAGEHGLDVIRRLIPQAAAVLHPGGYLIFEIGFTMASSVAELLAGWDEVHTVPDLAGIPRVMVARRKAVAQS
jgi:release factor glutamine methyltransferase